MLFRQHLQTIVTFIVATLIERKIVEFNCETVKTRPLVCIRNSTMELQSDGVDFELQNEIAHISDNASGGEPEGMAISANSHETLPVFSTLSIVNSSSVQIGNNIYYHGPVTVNQIEAPSNKHSTGPTNPSKETPESEKRIRPKQKKWCILIGGMVSVVLILLFIYLLIVGLTNSKTDLNVREYPTPLNDSTEWNPNKTRIYERSVWTPRGQSQDIEPIRTPVPVVMIIHSATSTCTTFDQCTEMIRGFQEFHMDNLDLEDIGYNFLVGGEGRIYEGRGWDKIGGHTYRWNRNSTGICLIGNFMNVEPTSQQISATHNLIKIGVHLGKISPNYRLLAHRQAIRTESPGKRLYALMADWPHFSSSS